MSFSKQLYDEFDRFSEPNTSQESECVKAFEHRDHQGATNFLLQANNPRNLFTTFGTSRASLLHLAAKNNWAELCDELIRKYNCDPLMGDLFDLTPLHYAAKYGAIDAMKCLISKHDCNAEVKASTAFHKTPLHFAVIHGQLEALIYLLSEVKVNTCTTNINGNTLLHLAVTQSNHEVVKYLLPYLLPDPASQNCNGDTVLHIAATRSNLEVVKYLLTYPLPDPAIQNSNGDTVLHIAVTQSNLEVVKYLLMYPLPDPAIQNCNGDTILHIAIAQSNLEMIKCLLTYPLPSVIVNTSILTIMNNAGKSPIDNALKKDCFELFLNSEGLDDTIKNKIGRSALFSACSIDRVDIVGKLLLHKNVSVSVMNEQDKSPLQLCCEKSSWKTAAYLFNHQGCEPVEEQSTMLLHGFCRIGDVDAVKRILSVTQANPNSKDGSILYTKDTPLHTACRCGYLEIVKCLLSQKNIWVMSSDSEGNTPLHVVCNTDILKALLCSNAVDITCRNKYGNTPLHSACMRDQYEVVKYLVNICNVDPTSKNTDGNTPLHLAYDGDVVKLLLSLPTVDPMCLNNAGDTPLLIACRTGLYNVIYELLYSGRMSKWCVDEAFSKLEKICVSSHHIDISSLFTAYNEQTRLLPHVLSTFSESPTVPNFAIDLECDEVSDAGVFDTFMYHSAFICGETSSGKSSLVKMLIEPKKSFLRKVFSSNWHPSITYAAASARSAGILPTRCEIKEIGKILFYELAGPFEYHDSHAAVLRNLLQTSSPVFLILVNITHDEIVIEKQLYYWSTFV